MRISNEMLWCRVSIPVGKQDALSLIETHIFFLQTLGYYPAMLFLTINRVGTLVETLISRLHVTEVIADQLPSDLKHQS